MELNGIKKYYNNNCILDGINLKLNKNGMVFILGPSGSGKSTLLNIIGMLDKDYQGNITILGKQIDKKESTISRERKDHIGFIFQDFNLINSLSVKDNILTSLSISNKEFDKNEYNKTMMLLGLDTLEDRDVTTLSGGERQRVAIARAVLRDSKIILADEPTGNLDSENTKIIFETLKKISSEKLVIIVSHDNEAADIYADCIIALKDKKTEIIKNDSYLNNSDIIVENDTTCKNSKSNQWIKKISLSNLKKRRKKLIPLLSISMFSLLFAGLILGIYSTINNICFSMNSVLETDKYKISSETDDFSSHQIDDDFYNDLSSKEYVEKSMKYYSDIVAIVNDSEHINIGYNVVDDSEFLRKRYLSNIDGNYINNKTEVIINKFLSEYLFNTSDSIGKSVEIIFNQKSYNCKIAGVLKTSKHDDQPELVISNELSKEFSMNLAANDIVNLQPSVENELADIISCSLEKNDLEKEIVCGRDIENDNEIIISVYQFNTFSQSIMKSSNYILSIDDIRKGNIPSNIYNAVFSNQITISSNMCKLANVRIVGIYDCNDEDEADIIYTSSDTFKNINNEKYNCIDAYLSINTDVDNFKDYVESKGYYIEQASGSAAILIAVQLQTIIMILGVVCIIILLISCVMINFSTKLNIKDRIYEVGVLKSLGAENNSIFKMFMNENLAICIITSTVSSILLILLYVLNMNFKLVTINDIPILTTEWWHIVIIFILNFTITMLSGLKEIIKVSKLNIIDALRNKYN